MKNLNYVCIMAFVALLAACESVPRAEDSQIIETSVSKGSAGAIKNAKQQWDEAKPALLETLRTNAWLRVVNKEDGALYIQIRSGRSYTAGGIKPSGDLAAALNHIAASIKGYEFLSIVVSGHSDNIGGKQHNVQLSEQRAKGVFDYLQSQGVQQSMRYEGLGTEKPIASNETNEGRAVNRRVDITIFPAEETPEIRN